MNLFESFAHQLKRFAQPPFQRSLELTERRTRVINRTLRDVEALPADQANQVLPAVAASLVEESIDDLPAETESLFTNGSRIDK